MGSVSYGLYGGHDLIHVLVEVAVRKPLDHICEILRRPTEKLIESVESSSFEATEELVATLKSAA